MNWIMFLVAVIGSVVVTSFTDWLFFGVLFHGRAKATPEIWRPLDNLSDRNRILLSTLFGAVSCAAFAWLCVKTASLEVCRRSAWRWWSGSRAPCR